ncbi:MAG: DUF5615 family PIN-like protein [Actinobacteria bacterium]|nr:DUF5615 family PIN-like protein [Actinomycetota bacterium]
MSKFLLDAGVPRSIQQFLESQGYSVTHVADIGLISATDQEIYQHAKGGRFVLITRDKDFGSMLDYPAGDVGVIIIRDLNLSAPEISDLFKDAWAKIAEEKLTGSLITIDRNKVRIRKY